MTGLLYCIVLYGSILYCILMLVYLLYYVTRSITGTGSLASHVISIALYPDPDFRDGRSWIEFTLGNKMVSKQ